MQDRRARHADDGVPRRCGCCCRAGFAYEVDAVRPDHRRGRGGQVRRRADHPRGAAHVPEPGPAPGRRSRRLVAGEDRAAAAAGRQRRPPRPRRRRRCSEISRLLKESIRYASTIARRRWTTPCKYARDMDMSLADKFVGMYVNDWTLDYGPRGREAVRRLLDEGAQGRASSRRRWRSSSSSRAVQPVAFGSSAGALLHSTHDPASRR